MKIKGPVIPKRPRAALVFLKVKPVTLVRRKQGEALLASDDAVDIFVLERRERESVRSQLMVMGDELYGAIDLRCPCEMMWQTARRRSTGWWPQGINHQRHPEPTPIR